MLRNEMKACASTAGRFRQFIEEQLAEIRKSFNSRSEVSLEERLKVLDMCSTVLEKLQKTMEGGAKLLVTKEAANADPGSSSNSTSVQDVINRLIGEDNKH
jgi:hypothetical protein